MVLGIKIEVVQQRRQWSGVGTGDLGRMVVAVGEIVALEW